MLLPIPTASNPRHLNEIVSRNGYHTNPESNVKPDTVHSKDLRVLKLLF